MRYNVDAYLVRRTELRRQLHDLIQQLSITLKLLFLRQLPCYHFLVDCHKKIMPILPSLNCVV